MLGGIKVVNRFGRSNVKIHLKYYLIIFLLLVNIRIYSQEYSLLLGLSYQDSCKIADNIDAGDVENLKTLCITTENDSLKIVADIPEIILPRDTSYWRIGLKRSVYNSWSEDFFWVCPLKNRPDIKGIDVESGETRQGSQSYYINYVNNNYVIIYSEGDAGCIGGANTNFWHDCIWIPIDRMNNKNDRPYDIALKMPDDLIKVFNIQFYQDFLKDGKCMLDTLNSKIRRQLEERPSQISLYREKGKWRCNGEYYWNCEAARGATAEFDVTQLPPHSFIGDDELSIPWDTISTYFPKASDAFTSPDGKILVVDNGHGFSFHKIVNSKIILTPELEYKLKGLALYVIMIKWYKNNVKTNSFFKNLSVDFGSYPYNIYSY
jgi:hypothetical protein